MSATRVHHLETIALTHPAKVTWVGEVDALCPVGTTDHYTVTVSTDCREVALETISLRALLDDLATSEPMYAEAFAARLYDTVREVVAGVCVTVEQVNQHGLQLTATVG